MPQNVAIFASGTGSNAIKILEYFKHTDTKFWILSNKTDAAILEKAKLFDVPTFTFNRKDFYENNTVLDFLAQNQIEFIVLAGFLWLVPEKLVQAYPNKIINLHPALLPKFGGKGMYGMKVHQAVIEAGEKESGITIHYVNAKYDEGEKIFQASCEISPNDSAEIVAKKVQVLEHEYLPKVLFDLLFSKK